MTELREFKTYRFIKSEDLNHHSSLYAGRATEWFVESGFISSSENINPKNLVCLKLDNIHFYHPVRGGDVVCYKSKRVFAGTSSLTSYIKVTREINNAEILIMDGFISFVHVDENVKPQAHGIIIKPETPQDVELNERARKLKEEQKK